MSTPRRPCILLLSPLKQFCGNTVHANRLKSNIEKGNQYECILLDPAELDEETFRSVIHQNNIVMCIGIHALHSGWLLQNCPLPFIIVLSGTDVNGWYTDEDKVCIMNKTVKNSRYAVCLTHASLEIAIQQWPTVRSKISVINHGISTYPSSFSIMDYCQQNAIDLPHNPIIFTLVCGIRPVKDPIFGVQAFTDFCKSYDSDGHGSSPFLVIIGPVLDKKYHNEFKEMIEGNKRIIHIAGLATEDVHAVMRQSSVVFNTSQNEGMPQAIMEACDLQVPVMVRNNAGNKALITDKITGLVFSTLKEFTNGAKQLLEDQKLRQQIVHSAYVMIKEKHSITQERTAIFDLIQKVLNNRSL